ncbi:cytochrome b/b6 domain-containing protein [Congregibacter litoralis]|uniref:Cytochrome b n=1 Tax=Congregibacter litoralis KT71 TaxID=314285 RepID=A4A3S4_9GAMM|nr:cytochrome b/b6 domain-containing protein [Congregibacter litoralis]EAQ99347.2 cytochrome b [Congregibacter litoralis KT71]
MPSIRTQDPASAEPPDHVLWDLPVRLIHWLIALLLPASWWTAEEGYQEVHQWLGLTLLVAVVTRLCWGLVGSPQSRFRDFVRGPSTVLAYFRGEPSPTPGHNPAGGWSAMVLWLLLLAQALTGTVNSDDVLYTGPFYYVFDSGVSDFLASYHETIFNVLLGFIALHVLSVIYHERLRKERLLKPMVLGKTEGRTGTGPAQPAYKALVIAILLGGMLFALLELAPAPPVSEYYW